MARMTDISHSESHLAVTHRWRQWQATTCSPNTINQRADVLERVVEHASDAAGRWIDPRDLDAEDLAAYLAQAHFGAATRATYFRALKSWFGWLHRTGRISVDPMLELGTPRQPEGVPRGLTDAEVRAVFEDVNLVLYAMMSLALFAGLRAHEIARFHGRQVRDGYLVVTGKGGKDAVLPLDPALAELAGHFPRDGYWFPSPWPHREHVRAEYVTVVVGQRFREVGIETGSAHRLRHTYGTAVQRATGDIRVTQRMLRHSSVATTMIYTSVSDDQMAAALRGLPRLTA